MRVDTVSEGDLQRILDIYYGNSVEMLGISDIREMLEYDRKVYGDRYKFLSLENLLDWYRSGGSERLIGLYEDGRLIGFAVFHPPRDGVAYIEEIHVAREWRGRGGGSLLLSAVEDRLRGAGARVIVLEAQVGAARFFERHGYVAFHLEEKMYMGRLQYIDMLKSLDRDLARAMRRALEALWEGGYREAHSLLEELLGAIPGRLPRSLVEAWRLVAYAHMMDEETQSYLPLAMEVREKAPKGVLRPLFEAVATRILVEGLASAGLYDRIIELCWRSIGELARLREELKRRRATVTLVLEKLIDYLNSLAHWCSVVILLSNSILRGYPASDRAVLAQTTCYTHWNVRLSLPLHSV